MRQILAEFFLSLGLSSFFIFLIRKKAIERGWLSYPREDRWHKKPIALYGSVGIILAIYPVTLFFLHLQLKFKVFLFFSFLIFILGLLDDIRPLSPSFKFILEIAISSFIIFLGGRLTITGRFLIDVLITYLWILGITNAFNLLDNIDGLSSGIGIISGLSLVILFLLSHNTDLSFHLIFILLGAYSGYLIFNFPPAKIFMGDGGSLFLGFTLSILSIPGYLNNLNKDIISTLSIILIFSIPIFDTILVTLNRLYFGKKATEGGKDHTSHRLLYMGLSEIRVNISLYLISLIGGLVGIYLYFTPGIGIFLGILYLLFLFLFGIYLSKLNIYKTYPKGFIFMLEEVLAKIRASEIVVDTIIIGGAYYFAFFLHYEGVKRLFGDVYVTTLPFAIFISLIFLFFTGIYKGGWDMPSFDKIERLIFAIILTDITIKIVTLYLSVSSVKWEVLITFNLIWFFLIILSRSIFLYFDYLIEKMKKR